MITYWSKWLSLGNTKNIHGEIIDKKQQWRNKKSKEAIIENIANVKEVFWLISEQDMCR